MRTKIYLLILITILTGYFFVGKINNINQVNAQSSGETTITLPVLKDTYIWLNYPTINYGSISHMQIAPGKTMLMQFDLSSIPRTAKVTSAVLSFYVDAVDTDAPSHVEPFIVPIKTDWNEAQATWNTATATMPWSQPGAQEYDSWTFSCLDTGPIEYAKINQWYTADVGVLVQSWVSGIFPNYGMALYWGGGGNNFYVVSKENTAIELKPKLEITYTDNGVLSLPDFVLPTDTLDRADFHIMPDNWTPDNISYMLDDLQEIGSRYFWLDNYAPDSNPTAQALQQGYINDAADRGLKTILGVNTNRTAGMATAQIIAFGSAMAQFFGDKVADYDMSSEANNDWYDSQPPAADPANYFPPIVAFFRGIKQGNPNARTSVAGLGSQNPAGYITAGLPYGIADWTDEWGAASSYTLADYRGGTYTKRNFNDRRRNAQWARSEGAAANPPHLITWQQEGMVRTSYGDAAGAKVILYESMRALYAGQSPMEWFKLYNWPNGPAWDDSQWGLITVPGLTWDGQGKVTSWDWNNRVKSYGFNTIKYINQYLDPHQYAPINLGMISTGETGFFKLAFKKNDNDLAIVIWNANNQPTSTLDPGITTDITLIDYGLTPTKIVDLITGNVQTLSSSDYSILDGKLTIKNIEVVDYPRIVTLFKDAPLIELKKSVDKTSAQSGDILTYTITYTNTGTQEAINVKLEDPIPQGTIFQSCTNNCISENNTISWTLPNLQPSDTGSIELQVRVE